MLLIASIIFFRETSSVKERFPDPVKALLYTINKLEDPKWAVHQAFLSLSRKPSSTVNNAAGRTEPAPAKTISKPHPSPLKTPPKTKADEPKILPAGPTFYEIKIDNPDKSSSKSLDLRILEWNGDGLAAALDAHPNDFAEKIKLLVEKHQINTLCLSLDKARMSDSREKQLNGDTSNSLREKLRMPGSFDVGATLTYFQAVSKNRCAVTSKNVYDHNRPGPPTPLYLTLGALYGSDPDAPAFSLAYLVSNSRDKNTHFRASLEREQTIFGKGNDTEPHHAEHMVTVAPYLTNNPSEEEKKNPNIYGVFYRKRGEPVENARKIIGQTIDFETGELVENHLSLPEKRL